ncbi:hypothetical protein OIU85_026124 [Salix viminalis]|uniref:Uncharacterized protein n=1 Tax=Salix viminalis TaxID=40686 RepID=A0A9Q0TN16_SALVM|nr:hypothetical protein OIU85_026124 [Salix viminalis]
MSICNQRLLKQAGSVNGKCLYVGQQPRMDLKEHLSSWRSTSTCSTSPGFCVFVEVEPHHERSGTLFPNFGCHGGRKRDIRVFPIKSSFG